MEQGNIAEVGDAQNTKTRNRARFMIYYWDGYEFAKRIKNMKKVEEFERRVCSCCGSRGQCNGCA